MSTKKDIELDSVYRASEVAACRLSAGSDRRKPPGKCKCHLKKDIENEPTPTHRRDKSITMEHEKLHPELQKNDKKKKQKKSTGCCGCKKKKSTKEPESCESDTCPELHPVDRVALLEDKIANVEKQIDCLIDMQESNEESDSLTAKIETLQQQLECLADEMDSSSQENKIMQKNLKSLQTKINSLTDEKESVQDNQYLEGKIKMLQKQMDCVIDEIDDLKEDIAPIQKPEPVTPKRVMPKRVTAESVMSELVTPEPVTPKRVASKRVTAESVMSELVSPELFTPEPVTPDYANKHEETIRKLENQIAQLTAQRDTLRECFCLTANRRPTDLDFEPDSENECEHVIALCRPDKLSRRKSGCATCAGKDTVAKKDTTIGRDMEKKQTLNSQRQKSFEEYDYNDESMIRSQNKRKSKNFDVEDDNFKDNTQNNYSGQKLLAPRRSYTARDKNRASAEYRSKKSSKGVEGTARRSSNSTDDEKEAAYEREAHERMNRASAEYRSRKSSKCVDETARRSSNSTDDEKEAAYGREALRRMNMPSAEYRSRKSSKGVEGTARRSSNSTDGENEAAYEREALRRMNMPSAECRSRKSSKGVEGTARQSSNSTDGEKEAAYESKKTRYSSHKSGSKRNTDNQTKYSEEDIYEQRKNDEIRRRDSYNSMEDKDDDEEEANETKKKLYRKQEAKSNYQEATNKYKKSEYSEENLYEQPKNDEAIKNAERKRERSRNSKADEDDTARESKKIAYNLCKPKSIDNSEEYLGMRDRRYSLDTKFDKLDEKENRPSKLPGGKAAPKLLRQDSSFCLHCENKEIPLMTRGMCDAVTKLIGDDYEPQEVALTILIQADNLYHVNVSVSKTGDSIGCLYATEGAIREAHRERMFDEFLTFFIVDARTSLCQDNTLLNKTFEFIKCHNSEKKK